MRNNDWDDSMGMTMEEFEQALSGSFAGDDLNPGDKVTGTVISISETTVFLDINAKSEGLIALEEFVDEDGKLTLKPGDEVSATVVRTGDEIKLSHRMRKQDQTMEMIREAYRNKIAVEGRVADQNKGGFDITLGGTRAFCPVSQIDIQYVEDPSTYVGASFHFLITQMDPKGKNIVVSRSRLLNQERARLKEETMASLEPGMIRDGEVRRITNFGAFVDIGGVDGLVHISQMSWDRVSDPNAVVEVGQEVRVKVLKIEQGTGKIALSMREASEKPWDEFIGSEIIEGNTYPGEVSRVEHFGAFVRLKPGLEGLLHISELKYGQRVNHPSEIVSPGDLINVKVINLDEENQRISLSMKQTEADPWTLNAQNLKVDSVLSVEVSKVKGSGLEVLIDNSLLAFIPASLSEVGQGEKLQNVYNQGDAVKARVVEVNQETRRLILEVVDENAEQSKTDVADYLAKASQGKEGGFGNLGSVLQKALDKKNKR